MTATVDPTAGTRVLSTPSALDRADGVELLGGLQGSGYREGAALVRRADGQVVQIGPLMYALLESVDGRRSIGELAAILCERLDRACDEEHVVALARKLAAQGLLAGSEENAPPRRNPLLSLRWKVLVTDPVWTRRLTAPFAVLFNPWIVWPVLACFAGVFWYVLVDKGVASATSNAFGNPSLLLLVFVLAIASAGFHEVGHAAACRYGGATPGGMGMGIYLVWPAFYTDVTDAYRLPRRDRLRVDLGGIYFNAIVAVVTLGVWLAWRVDALLLLVALQLLIMVKNLSPVIRSDGYHILADATGVPDLYAHIGPTLRRLLPWRRNREPSALTGRARALVTLWVLVVVPVLLSLMLAAVVLLPRLLASAWDSGRTIVSAMPHESTTSVAAGALQLVALSLPVLGSLLVTQRLLRMLIRKGRGWSEGRPVVRAALVGLGTAAAAGMAFAWWPSGQYQPVRASEDGTLIGLGNVVASPGSQVRPLPPAPVLQLAPGKHLAVALIPRGGVTKQHPALLVIPGKNGQPAVAVLASGGEGTRQVVPATAFPFKLPPPPAPGSSQALSVNTRDGAVTYDIAYSLVTVSNGAPVTATNSAYALAHCNACTTVAVSFQVVLVVGTSTKIAPINAAVALNQQCPGCVTTAIADQIVVTLKSQPSPQLVQELENALQKLNAISALGSNGTPQAVAATVAQVQQEIDTALRDSGQLANTTATPTTQPATPGSSTAGTSTAPATTAPAATTAGGATTTAPRTTTTTQSTTTRPATTTTAPTTTSTEPTTTTATTTTTTTTPTTTTTAG